MKPLDHRDVEPWFAIAEADLAILELIWRDKSASPGMFGGGCFHAQQAAEKALKGLLIAQDLPAPRTHDLIALFRSLPDQPSSLALREPTARLNEYGVGPRYPTTYAPRSKVELSAARDDAKSIVVWALKQLGN